jgi:polysaccharide biosynthesis transport protein
MWIKGDHVSMMNEQAVRGEDTLDLSALIGVLRRQYRVIAMAVASILVLAVIYLFAVTPKFTATALIAIEPNRGVLSEDSAMGNNSAAISAQVEGEVAILKSADVLLALIADGGLVNDPEFGARLSRRDRVFSWLGIERDAGAEAGAAVSGILERVGNAIQVRRRGLTYLIEVSVTSEDPSKAAELANRLVEIYTDRQVEGKIRQILASRDILAPRIDNAQEELERLQYEADRFLEGVVDDFVESSDREDLVSVRDRFSLAQRQLDTLRQQSAALRAITDGRSIASSQAELLSEAMRTLAAEREALQRQLADDDAEGIDAAALRAALLDVDQRLQEEAARERETALAGISDLTQVADRARAELRDAALASDLPPSELSTFYRLQQETATARLEYESLLRRLRQLETLADVQISDAVMASSAVTPARASFPNARLILALAMVAAMGLGVGLAFINEYLVGGVTSEDQLRDLLHAPTALPVPAIAGADEADVSDQVYLAPLSGFAESFRQVRRQAARLARPSDGGCVFLVTSSVPEEGKTTAAIALARTLAMSGTRTLLIDFDLRKPSIGARIGAPATSRLLMTLSGAAGPEYLASGHFREEATGLEVLVGGGRADVPTDTLASSARVAQLIGILRREFEAIVLDTAPVLPVVDTLYLAPQADVVLMLARYASTNQRDIRRAVERIRPETRDGAQILPILSMERRVRRAYYYGGYYSGRGYNE